MVFDPIAHSKIRGLLTSGGAGYVKKRKKVIAPEGMVVAAGDGLYLFATMVDGVFTPLYLDLVVGETYNVRVNGADYTCVAFNEDEVGTCLGNAALLYSEDLAGVEGDPFVVSQFGEPNEEGKTAWMALFAAELTDPAISISQETETIHTINPKYLPGVCLPVVELTTQATNERTELTAEEAAMLDTLNGAPCLMKCPVGVEGDNGIVFGTALYFSLNGLEAYMVSNVVQTMRIGDTWTISLVG